MKRAGLFTIVLAVFSATMLASGQGARDHSSVSASSGLTPPTTLAGSFVIDLTWVSNRRGWVLAAAPCARGLCPEVARTVNGGRTWQPLQTPPGFIEDERVDCSRKPCVTQIRFVTASVGYLFGPALFISRDGGRSWVRQTSPPVEALEPASSTVVRVVYDHTGCPGPCHRTVEQAQRGSTIWRPQLRLGLPRADSREGRAQTIREGSQVIYVPIYGDLAAGAGTLHAIIFRSLDGGRTWRRLDDPCGGNGRHVYDAIGLAAAPGGVVTTLCAPRGGNPTGDFVLTSTNHGSSWQSRHPVPRSPRLIAAASRSHIVVADGQVSGNGLYTYHLAVSADGGRHWNTVVSDRERIDPAAPSTAFLGFEDAKVGRWVGNARAIWTTQDGGVHWTRRPFQ